MNHINQYNHINFPSQLNQNMNNDLNDQIQNNNKNLEQNNFWINLNLINSIIDFCHKNGNDYVNYQNKIQIMNLINRLNPDFSQLKDSNKYINAPLHYIE